MHSETPGTCNYVFKFNFAYLMEYFPLSNKANIRVSVGDAVSVTFSFKLILQLRVFYFTWNIKVFYFWASFVKHSTLQWVVEVNNWRKSFRKFSTYIFCRLLIWPLMMGILNPLLCDKKINIKYLTLKKYQSFHISTYNIVYKYIRS